MCLSLALPLQGVHAPCVDFLQEAVSSVSAFIQEYYNERQENTFVVHFISNSEGNKKKILVFGPCSSPSSIGLKLPQSSDLCISFLMLFGFCSFFSREFC